MCLVHPHLMQCCSENLWAIPGEIDQRLANADRTMARSARVVSILVQRYQFAPEVLADSNHGRKYRPMQTQTLHAASEDAVSVMWSRDTAICSKRPVCSNWSITITGYVTPVAEPCRNHFSCAAIALEQGIVVKVWLLQKGAVRWVLHKIFTNAVADEPRRALIQQALPDVRFVISEQHNLPR